jgi:hypothetical protein
VLIWQEGKNFLANNVPAPSSTKIGYQRHKISSGIDPESIPFYTIILPIFFAVKGNPLFPFGFLLPRAFLPACIPHLPIIPIREIARLLAGVFRAPRESQDAIHFLSHSALD